MKISNKIDQVIRKQDYWFFLGQSKPWSFPTILIRVSEPRTIGFIFGIEKVVKISNKIYQGIRTQDYWFYSWDRSSRECLQQDWSGYQNPERLILFLVQIKLWSFPKILIRVILTRNIGFYVWYRASGEAFQKYWSGYQNPGQFIFIFGTYQVVIISNNIDQGIRTRDYWFLCLVQRTLWFFQPDWSGYQDPGILILDRAGTDRNWLFGSKIQPTS